MRYFPKKIPQLNLDVSKFASMERLDSKKIIFFRRRKIIRKINDRICNFRGFLFIFRLCVQKVINSLRFAIVIG